MFTEKLTHTDRYWYFNSHYDKTQKISAANTLLQRALNLLDSETGIARKIPLPFIPSYSVKIKGKENKQRLQTLSIDNVWF